MGQGLIYTSYYLGNPEDRKINALGGVCLMGGGTENDSATKWFLQRANGGDILVLRTSGADGYNEYFWNLKYKLGISINSIETIVFHERRASYEPYIHKKIQQAEAIWIAGGNQATYVEYWRNTPIDSLINEAIQKRNIAIGGTSAGMAILGEYYFSACKGTIRSEEALKDPFHPNLCVEKQRFLLTPLLQGIITDTHYDNPDRKGRHIVFLAKLLKEHGIEAKGIACDEHTAVCISPEGIARVFGEYPQEEDYAYFIQVNCENTLKEPEIYEPQKPLEWNHNNTALIAYQIAGTPEGKTFFDLSNWRVAEGGEWQYWSVIGGEMIIRASRAPNCPTTSIKSQSFPLISVKGRELIFIQHTCRLKQVLLINSLGQFFLEKTPYTNTHVLETSIDIPGFYFLVIQDEAGAVFFKKFYLPVKE
ncbi:MAG: cyanophycinase [Bacteroidia bacterium]|nr:cyanophycinase [Bacteroidia bacterium]MDW8159363.1 cyanophycinase [Bacteroidia bacterium]